jgi:hypothetical protein
VTSGYRVCLVYNLAIAGKKQQPSAPQSAAAVEQAAQLLEELFAGSSELSKVAIPFEHQYTEAGLDPKQLKGSDRARADVLVRAAESLDYECYLALLTHHQSGEPDYETLDVDPYRSRRSYGWSDYEDKDEEDEEDDGSGAEMGEVYDEERSLNHWLDPQGRKQPFGEIHLDENEILSEEGKEGWSVRQEISEATGNEGASMERWYRQGVLVIWPRERYFSILAGEGQATALPALEKMAAHSKKPAALADCRTFAEAIISHWMPHQSLPDSRGSSGSGRLLKVLERLDSPELVQRFLRDVLPKDFDGSEGKALHRLFQRFGWGPFGEVLRDFLAQQKLDDYYTRIEPIVSIFEPLCCDAPALTEERRAVCVSLAEPLAQTIERWDTKRANAWYRQEENRAGLVANVIRIFATIGAIEHLNRFVSHALADQKHYDLHEVLIPDVKAISMWLAKVPAAQEAASRILQHCLTELRAATAEPIEPPKDWTRDAKLGCNCEDCRALSRFLRDPAQRVGRFPIRKERRQHLHQQIEGHQCDCTHVTERIGSPQTLVCTKTQASYERRQKQYEVDQQLLAELEALAGDGSRTAVRRSSDRRKPKK